MDRKQIKHRTEFSVRANGSIYWVRKGFGDSWYVTADGAPITQAMSFDAAVDAIEAVTR